MLIDCPRLTSADRQHWQRLEQADRDVSQLLPLHEMASHAMMHILDFASAGDCFVGVSWGKDSTVLAHLVSQMQLSIPCVYFDHSPRDNPDCKLVRDAFLLRHRINYREHRVDPRRPGDTTSKAARYARWVREAGLPERRITGVRAAESPIRELSAWTHGTATEMTCRPILRWSTEAIFAYLCLHDLPVHPAYAQSRGGLCDRNWLRVAPLGGSEGTGHGRAQWEQEYYGDVLNRLAVSR